MRHIKLYVGSLASQLKDSGHWHRQLNGLCRLPVDGDLVDELVYGTNCRVHFLRPVVSESMGGSLAGPKSQGVGGPYAVGICKVPVFRLDNRTSVRPID